MTPELQREISQNMSDIQIERAKIREIEQCIHLMKLEQEAIVEEILRANGQDFDVAASTNLKLKQLQEQYDEQCSINSELKE